MERGFPPRARAQDVRDRGRVRGAELGRASDHVRVEGVRGVAVPRREARADAGGARERERRRRRGGRRRRRRRRRRRAESADVHGGALQGGVEVLVQGAPVRERAGRDPAKREHRDARDDVHAGREVRTTQSRRVASHAVEQAPHRGGERVYSSGRRRVGGVLAAAGGEDAARVEAVRPRGGDGRGRVRDVPPAGRDVLGVQPRRGRHDRVHAGSETRVVVPRAPRVPRGRR
mmetsp:Transcript_11441/g.41251  ORF Transcript_11441/g.41251 Transcript_11441/m.41251 type:complete len:232 (+) Transcript_11441:213-908(+)